MLSLCPITQREAFAFVKEHHRHHRAPRGSIVTVGVEQDGEVVGVAIVGRPVARALDDGYTAEVTRLCVLPDLPRGRRTRRRCVLNALRGVLACVSRARVSQARDVHASDRGGRILAR